MWIFTGHQLSRAERGRFPFMGTCCLSSFLLARANYFWTWSHLHLDAWCLSNFNVSINHLEILLRCRFWLSGSGVGLPGGPQTVWPHIEKQTLIPSGLLPASSEVPGLSLWTPGRGRRPWHPCASLARRLSASLFILSRYHQRKRVCKTCHILFTASFRKVKSAS